MARNDGIDRTNVRNLAVSDKAVSNTQQHNEREKDSYRNPDIIPQRVASKPMLDESGKPVLQKKGKPVLKKSYSILQDDFFNFMRAAGYTDVERGECGSTEEHLTVTQFKVQREQERLDSLTAQIDQKEQHLTQTKKTLSKTEKELATVQKKAAVTKDALIHAQDVESLGKRTLLGNYSLTEDELYASGSL